MCFKKPKTSIDFDAKITGKKKTRLFLPNNKSATTDLINGFSIAY